MLEELEPMPAWYSSCGVVCTRATPTLSLSVLSSLSCSSSTSSSVVIWLCTLWRISSTVCFLSLGDSAASTRDGAEPLAMDLAVATAGELSDELELESRKRLIPIIGNGKGINETWWPEPDCDCDCDCDAPIMVGVRAKLVCFAPAAGGGGATGVLAALTDPAFMPPSPNVASSSSDVGPEASVSVDIDVGLPRCSELAEAAAAGGAVMVTSVLAALFTADVEL